MNIKKGDNIIVITGGDKGKKGKVVKAFPALGKIVVEGINVRKKHQKPRKSGEKGQILSIAMPIKVANVMIVDPKDNTRSRVGSKIVAGKKVRISKKSGQEI
ncbi:MAG: 50S ribosomal protein L24 [Candidatus Paceibacterota bacterium]|jgi:large subunit ribosomal protein L24